jgi:hypothetical protein
MARGIRFTKPERDLIRQALGADGLCRTKAEVTAKTSLLDKLEAAEKPEEKKSGLSVKAALDVFKGVLGFRLVAPPPGAVAIWSMMQKRIVSLGLTPMDCITLAKTAGTKWQGQIKAQSLINQAEALLQDAQDKPFEDVAMKPRGAPQPVAMDDM